MRRVHVTCLRANQLWVMQIRTGVRWRLRKRKSKNAVTTAELSHPNVSVALICDEAKEIRMSTRLSMPTLRLETYLCHTIRNNCPHTGNMLWATSLQAKVRGNPWVYRKRIQTGVRLQTKCFTARRFAWI